jgi:NAD(P)-dependent dehydrogenase (short-subunit alcohol dehydrogenase family)/acyl dehydratase/putative sterol carrier protein
MTINTNAVGKKIGPTTRTYDWKDVVLYALGVGAGFDELEYVYEEKLKVIPSFAIISLYDFLPEFISLTGVNLAGILHGEHDLLIHSPVPAQGGTLTSEAEITAIYDKGADKGALVIGEITTYDQDGKKLYTNIATLFSRLDGGFGGEPSPSEIFTFPDRAPDFEEVGTPSPNQPLLYRLSGDTFALHIDPDFAQLSGFEAPIMHGLCTHGFVCRAVIKHLFPGEPERLTRFRNRFSKALYPGVPIKTQIWKISENQAVFKTLDAESGEVVIDRGLVEWTSKAEADRRAGIEGVMLDGQVAVVTGAGGGLGRSYALELARRGARVVVNDLGGARDGSGASTSLADSVVEEITTAGGTAVASYDSVATLEGGQNIVQTALDNFGRIDILINNAGILRDKSFAKMTPEMWGAVLDVHLQGAFNVTHPAFKAMREQGYGRIVMTTSAAGLFGNFGQTNYSAAKLGIVGLMNTLKLEGEKYNIKVNTVAPLATTRLTEDVLPPDFAERLGPELVTPLVIYLCSQQCADTGLVLNAGMGFFSRAAVVSGFGAWPGDGDGSPGVGEIHRNWEKIASLRGAQEYPNANAALMDMLSGPKEPLEEAAMEAEAEAPGGAVSVQEIFERMPSTFQPEAAAGVEVIFQYNISGAGGGDWYVTVKEDTCQVEAGQHDSPVTTLKMDSADFIDLVEGRLPAMQAYSSGKLKIEGDLMKSQLIQKLFKFG